MFHHPRVRPGFPGVFNLNNPAGGQETKDEKERQRSFSQEINGPSITDVQEK